nr:topoisomerase C-terminal repeat-containing protein [Aliarcobacter thereius]
MFLFTLPRVVGIDDNGNEIKANIGRFGPYLQVKSTYYSLKTDDPYKIEEKRAKEIISEIDEAKRKALIQDFPKEKIQILNGQYGPYIKQGRKNFKIPKTKDASALTLEECLEIIEKDSKTKKAPAKKTTTKRASTTSTKKEKKE